MLLTGLFPEFQRRSLAVTAGLSRIGGPGDCPIHQWWARRSSRLLRRGRRGSGWGCVAFRDGGSALAAATASLDSLHRELPTLAAPVTTVLGGPFAASSQRAWPVGQVELVPRDNALAHVRLLTPPDRRGRGCQACWLRALVWPLGRAWPCRRAAVRSLFPSPGSTRTSRRSRESPSSWWLAGAIYYQSRRPSITLGSQQVSSCRGPACWMRQGSEPPVGRSTTWRPPPGCSQR